MASKKKDNCKCGSLKDYRAKKCINCCQAKKTNKICPKCHIDYPIEEFSIRKGENNKIRRRSRCKKCESDDHKKNRLSNPEKFKNASRSYAKKHPDKIREWSWRSRWKKMGFDPDEIKSLIDMHEHGCEICGNKECMLVVDHCHVSNKIRGILCSECNLGIGKFKDCPDTIMNAYYYLTDKSK